MVSVIIPSYNSERTIEKCLKSLKSQNFNDPYEIILVDSSSDSTPQIVQRKFPEIIFIHLEIKTDPGTARNIGVKKSSGDLLLFIDSDCEADPNWIKHMVELHRSTHHAAIGGAVINGNDPTIEVAWAGYMAEFREFLPEIEKKYCRHIPTCNISYKTEIFKELGGFHPEFYPQEDLEFNYRLSQKNQSILFSPDILVRHHHRTELKTFFQHQHKIGLITAKVLKILPLDGSFIARNKLFTVFAFMFLPIVKLMKTILIFVKYQPKTILHHPFAVVIFAIGLIPWIIGFLFGSFSKGIAVDLK